MPAALTRGRWPALPALLLLTAVFPALADREWEAWEEELTTEAEATWFDDAPLEEEVALPGWFHLSFLNLREDLDDTVALGKSGLIVYFGQKYCPYCKALMEEDFGRQDIADYTRRHFEVVAIDIHGNRMVTNLAGEELSEKAFSERNRTHLTPSLLFYDKEGREALKLVGYYPPYQFRAALEYVADGHYRNEGFRAYLERADPSLVPREGELNRADFFAPPPYNLDRSRLPAQQPLAVFFEQADCHACDILHTDPLRRPEINRLLRGFDAVQLDIWADTPVITPAGKRTTARRWARELGLFYTPTLLFFDEAGQEVLRLDSVTRFYRLRRVLDYVASGAHRNGVSLQRWQREGR